MTKIRQDSNAAYEKYAGKEVEHNNSIGVICGFDNRDLGMDLIIAIQSGNKGWRSIISSDILFSNKKNPMGYWYINVSSIEEILIKEDGTD